MTGIFLISLLMVTDFFSPEQPDREKMVGAPGTVVCRASGKVEKHYIPPSPGLLNRLKSGKEATAEILVTYTQFPDQARDAFEYAVAIWENTIRSPVPVRVNAVWKSMEPGILGSCQATDYFRNSERMPEYNRYYTIAATEKIEGRELNGDDFDMVISLNKDIKWYFGIDGHTPDSLYDFVTTAVHEIAHGLGFTGFFYAAGSLGGYGSYGDRTPSAYDGFVENSQQKHLVTTSLFRNPSVDLFGLLTSGHLYSGSSVVLIDGGGIRPRLYAPDHYNEGSSIYHLDETTYRAGNPNALMTPSSGKGEAIHDPGPLTLGILADVGWKNVKIEFVKPPDVEFPEEPVLFEAAITSDFPLDSSSLFLVYSTDAFTSHIDSLLLLSSGKTAVFSNRLPLQMSLGVITYFLRVKDIKNRQFTVPSRAPDLVYDLKIGPDTIMPVLSHVPPGFVFSSAAKKTVEVKVTDNIGIDTVYAEYLVNGAEASSAMVRDSGADYSGFLNFRGLPLRGGDSVSYRFVAIDSSSRKNKKKLPATGYFNLKIEQVFEPVTRYFNDFNLGSDDFIADEFRIETTSGFSDGALHSLHPYPSPDTDDTYISLNAFLRYPVVLKQGEAMDFDEVVLVEPGKAGKEFGDYGFWDYVIIEGSRDHGETWLPFLDGYDSGSNETWYNNYQQNISGGNSLTEGKKEWFVNRRIDLLANGNFSAGDTVFFRFRILSDPYAHGWGWVIDNLKIQIPVSAPRLRAVSPGHVSVYPNPASEKVVIHIANDSFLYTVGLSLINQFGQKVYLTEARNVTGDYQHEIILKNYPVGLYLVAVSVNGEKIGTRKIMKNAF